MCTHKRLKSTKEEIALAIDGKFTKYHIFMTRAIRMSISNIEDEIVQPYVIFQERILYQLKSYWQRRKDGLWFDDDIR